MSRTRRTVEIRVTAEDIAAGVRRDRCGCPLAIACRRAGLVQADVNEHTIAFGPFAARTVVLMPSAMSQWRHDYDNGEAVKPETFALAVPHD